MDLFGKKKKRILESGISAQATVLAVQDTGMTINDNPRVKLKMQVMPDGGTPFEATKTMTVSRVAIPRAGDQFYVKYDPANPDTIEMDSARAQAQNAVAQTMVEEAAATQLPPDLATNGILGRGSCVSVDKTPVGNLVSCTMEVGVRLIDGTPLYRTTVQASLTPEHADMMVAGQATFTIRADPNNHQRIAISLSEQTPSVPITDPAVIDPPARALADGDPCNVAILLCGPQQLRTPNGEELYAVKVRVVEDGSEFQIFQPVPANCASLMQSGKQLPAKRLATEPQVLSIDWAAAQAQGIS